MNDCIEERTLLTADFVIMTGATVRKAAKLMGVSKSTTHIDLTERLRKIDKSRRKKVAKILKNNLEQRAIRGGMATKRKRESTRK